MPAISSNDIRNGITLKVDDGLFTVVEFQHVKPGKGGAFVRTKLRNARSGAVINGLLESRPMPVTRPISRPSTTQIAVNSSVYPRPAINSDR